MTVRQTSFLRKALAADEEVLVEARLHWTSYLVANAELFLAFLLAFASIKESVLILLGVFFLILGLYGRLKASSTQMVVTNKRVICKTGILAINTEELKNAKIESVEIRQSIMGRLLGYATISFSGTGTSDVFFNDVEDPWETKKAIDAAISRD